MQQVKALKSWLEPFEAISGRVQSASELEEMLAVRAGRRAVGRGRARDRRARRRDRGVPSAIAAFRTRRLPRCAARDQRRRRRHRGAGLGADAHADVHALGGAKGLHRRDPRPERRRRGRHQGRGARDQGAVRVRLPQGRKRACTVSCASRRSTAQARRHTSFASAFVYPVVDNEINIEIRDEDIRMDVFRASGAGGQHVNKTSSAVRLTHIPSGNRHVVAGRSGRSTRTRRRR